MLRSLSKIALSLKKRYFYRKWNQGEQIQFEEKKRKNLDPGGMYIVLDNEMISHAFLFE